MNDRPTLSQLKPPPIAVLMAVAAVAASTAIGVLAPPVYGAAADTTLVNEVPGGFADDASGEASVSANGRFVAFSSYATNLSDADGDGAQDVFVRDMREETTILVSRANGIDGAAGQADSSDPSISANGRYVAFASLYDEFTDEDGPGLDVFVRDLKTGSTALVSRATGKSGAAGDSVSHAPAISANGRFVAFESNADNFSNAAADTNNVFVRDLKKGTTTLVSRKSGARGAGGKSASGEAAISADGRRVAFYSGADNLSKADGVGYADIFLRDLRTNETALVSRRSGGGTGANSPSYGPSISADGDRIAFMSSASNLEPESALANVFIHDVSAQTTKLVSKRSRKQGDSADESSGNPSISADGRRVAFVSYAKNLSDADGDPYLDVFVRDLDKSRTRFLSVSSEGEAADADSSRPSLSDDGRFVAYGSNANNLSNDDLNGIPDVFRTPIQQGPGA